MIECLSTIVSVAFLAFQYSSVIEIEQSIGPLSIVKSFYTSVGIHMPSSIIFTLSSKNS